jgi:hypothetical protein
VVAEQDIVVRGNGGQFREHSLNVLESPKGISDCYGQYLPDEARSQLPVSCRQAVSRSSLATHNEVYFQVSDPFTVGNNGRALIYVDLLITIGNRSSYASLAMFGFLPSLEYLELVLQSAAMD